MAEAPFGSVPKLHSQLFGLDSGYYSIEDFSMADQRKSDSEPYSKFRTSRFSKENLEWYYLTREGTIEGPFERKIDAENRLENYIKIMTSGLLPDSELSLQPL